MDERDVLELLENELGEIVAEEDNVDKARFLLPLLRIAVSDKTTKGEA